jgi:hypothetical protein
VSHVWTSCGSAVSESPTVQGDAPVAIDQRAASGRQLDDDAEYERAGDVYDECAPGDSHQGRCCPSHRSRSGSSRHKPGTRDQEIALHGHAIQAMVVRANGCRLLAVEPRCPGPGEWMPASWAAQRAWLADASFNEPGREVASFKGVSSSPQDAALGCDLEGVDRSITYGSKSIAERRIALGYVAGA